MIDATRSNRPSGGSTLGPRTPHLTLATWYARLAGATPRTTPVSALSTPVQAPLAATPHTAPLAARAAA